MLFKYLLLTFLSFIITSSSLSTTAALDPKPITGPYNSTTTTITIPTLDSSDRRVDIHYPANYPNKSFPLIAYAHGLDNDVTDYTRQFKGLVSFGYVIFAHYSCKEGCKDDTTSLPYDPSGFANYYVEQLKVIEWARSHNNKTYLPCGTIDFSNGVAIAGHSMGGQATLFSSSYGNASKFGIKAAVMHHAFTHEYPSPSIPFLAFTGGEDVVAYPEMTENYYNAAAGSNLARGLVNRKVADHFEPEDPFFPFYNSYNPLIPQFTAAWFKLHLENKTTEFDIDFEEMIYGNDTKSICNGGDSSMIKCETKQ